MNIFRILTAGSCGGGSRARTPLRDWLRLKSLERARTTKTDTENREWLFIINRYTATTAGQASHTFIMPLPGVWVRRSAFNIKMMTSLTLLTWTWTMTKVKRPRPNPAMVWPAWLPGEKVEELVRWVRPPVCPGLSLPSPAQCLAKSADYFS